MDDIDDLVHRMTKLKLDDPAYAVAYMRFVTKYPAFSNLLQAPRLQQSLPPPSVQPLSSAQGSHKSSPTPTPYVRHCFYCEEDGHTTRNCPYAEVAIQQGLIIRSPDGYLKWSNGSRIDQRRGEGGMRAAVKAQAEAIASKPLDSQAIQSLLIEVAPSSNQVSSYLEEYAEDSEDEGHYVYDVERGEKKNSRDSPYPKKKPDNKRIRFDGVEIPTIKKRDDKKPASQVPPVEDPTQPSTSSPLHDEIMVDAPPPPITTKKTPQYQYRSSIQDLATPEQLVDKTLALPLTVTVGQLLANSLPVKRVFEEKLKTHRIAVDPSKTPTSTLSQVFVNHVDGADLALASPLARIRGYCNDVEIEFTMDQGSEINIITKECLNRIKPPINSGLRVIMRDASGGSQEMEGVCEAMKITIGGMVSHANVHVGPDSANYQVLLGRPWFRYVRSKWEDREDGLWISFTDPDNSRRIIEVHAVPVPDFIPRSSFYTSLATFTASSILPPIDNFSISRAIIPRVQMSESIAAVNWLQSQQALLAKTTKHYKPVAQKVKPVATTSFRCACHSTIPRRSIIDITTCYDSSPSIFPYQETYP